MEIFEVIRERLRLASKGVTSIMVTFLIVLPVLFIVSMVSRNSNLDISAIHGVEVQNAAALGVDSKSNYESSQPTSIPDEKLLNDSLADIFGKRPDSKYESSQPTSTPDDKRLNGTKAPRTDKASGSEYEAPSFGGTLAPAFIGGSVSKNGSSEPTSTPQDKMLNGTLAPTYGEKSGSKNKSSQSAVIADDKLLDGLISPEFDEGSCLSRYKSFLYHRISPHKPSPFLLSKLRNYENLHKRCGPHTKLYNKTLKILKQSHISSSSVCKYIIWRPVNGLGNRMISMASSFLYTLLTNRVLLLSHGTDMADLFCEPFPNVSWSLPMDFPLNHQLHNSKLRYAHSLEGMIGNDSINKLMESTPSYLYLTLQKHDSLDKKFFYCDQGQAILQKVPWLILLSEQYFAPSFFLMPSLQKEVSSMFPDRETVFHHLGRYLFSPSNQVWEQLITRFYDAYLAKADERIGLQIRVFHANTKMFQIVRDQILACTLKKKLIPEVDTGKPAALSSRSQKSSKAILLTSLYSEFYKNLSNMYMAKPTVTGEVIGVYQPSHEGYQHRGDNMHNMKAWAEIYLLSLCDVLVTSAWSTFGYVAQGLGGLKPWVLHRPGNGMYQPCKRAMSMEPCFHYPFSYDCKSGNKVDVGALVPYIRKCEDRGSGVKLFNQH